MALAEINKAVIAEERRLLDPGYAKAHLKEDWLRKQEENKKVLE